MTDLNFCVLGDDLARGKLGLIDQCWATLLIKQASEAHGDIIYYNLGISGETSVQVGQRIGELSPRMPKDQDNRLIVAVGMNDTDLVDGKPAVSNAESVEALKTLIVKTKGHMKVLIVGLTPVYEPHRNLRVKRLNGLFQELCQKAHIPFIDIYSSLSEDVQFKRELIRGDRVFPSLEGHRKIADLIWNDRAWWFN